MSHILKIEHFQKITERFSLEYFEYNTVGKYKIKKFYFFAQDPFVHDRDFVRPYYVHNTKTRLCREVVVIFDRCPKTIQDIIKHLKMRTSSRNKFSIESFEKFPFELVKGVK